MIVPASFSPPTHALLVLVQSLYEDRPAWWFVKCFDKIKAEKLKGAFRTQAFPSIQLEEYGAIICSGWGEAPPASLIQSLYDCYASLPDRRGKND